MRTSLSAYPAALRRAAMRRAASVQSPAESVVLVSTSSLKVARKRSNPESDSACAVAVNNNSQQPACLALNRIV